MKKIAADNPSREERFATGVFAFSALRRRGGEGGGKRQSITFGMRNTLHHPEKDTPIDICLKGEKDRSMAE